MHVKTLEGLIGAHTNVNIMNVPVRVYKEASRKGDTGTMERAMGYVGEFAQKAEDNIKIADEGLEKEKEEAKQQKKLEREKRLEKRKESENKAESGHDEDTPLANKENAIYTKTGEANQSIKTVGTDVGAQVDVSL